MKGITNVINKKPSHVEKVNIELKTNQSDHTDLIGTTFNVSYGEYTNSYTWNGKTLTIAIPAYVEYTITYEGVNDYKTPESVTYIAQDGNARSVVATYLTESVTVVLTADNGDNMIGQQITINGVVHTYNGIAVIQKVPFDTSYEISVNDKDGYNTPASQTYTADSISRTVEFVYIYDPGVTNPTNGVWIQSVDNKFYTTDDWDGSKQLNGIALVTNKCSFIIQCDWDYTKYNAFGGTLFQGDIEGVVLTKDESVAIKDYNGYSNTQRIIEYYEQYSMPSLWEHVKNYTFPNGKKGYLGSAGEWKAFADNRSSINDACIKCGCTTINHSFTSTLYGDEACDELWEFTGGVFYGESYTYCVLFATLN